MNRRAFLRSGIAAGLALSTGRPTTARAARSTGVRELRITRILLQNALGRRLTPVAPNAYAPFRGYEVKEPVLRIFANNNLEGICHNQVKPELLQKLIGLDPFALFEWNGDVIKGPAEQHRSLLAELRGTDIALLDLLGRAMRRPVAALLGKTIRRTVKVYDSSLYMEDLLKPDQRFGLAYLKGAAPQDAAEFVARKAEWVLERPEGVRILKIKIGRAKWMNSFDAALERDIAVVKAVQSAVGNSVTLFVDGNDGYGSRPLAAADFALGVADAKLYAMEEMFSEEKTVELRAVKNRLRGVGLSTKLADGENFIGGIPEQYLAERFEDAKPLFDINQPDMNATGYLRLQSAAAASARYGLTVAPHNFGSKLGLYAQVHLGLVTPNWEFCEMDDSQFPAFDARGIHFSKGVAQLKSEPGLGVTLREDALEKPTVAIER
jgi:L-alanine-DL-glutamate epimerase-like enolase superfamily enzyme